MIKMHNNVCYGFIFGANERTWVMRLSQWSGDIFIVDMRGKDARVLKSKSIKTKEIYWGVTHPSKGGPMGCVEWVGAVCERESGGGFQWK